MRRSIGLILTVLLVTADAVAGAGPAFDALMSEVLEKNPELKLYEAQIAAAKGSRRAAGSWANPEVSGSIGRKRTWDEEDALTGKGNAGEVSLTQTFEWPGRIGLRKAIADREIELTELGLEQFRASLVTRAKVAAYKWIAAQANEAATLEVAEHFRAMREVLSQRSPAGLTPLLEMRVIEAMELNIQRKASEVSLAASAALFELNQMRGAAPDTKPPLGHVDLVFYPFEKSRDDLVKIARSNDFTVRERAVELKRQGFHVGLAENERLPAVTVGPSFSQEEAGEKERVVAAAVSVPVPFWDLNQGNIAAARARRAQAETSLSVAERDAERRAIQTAMTYETKLKEMARWQPDTIRHFKEAAELADRHYRLGAVPVSIYVELQTQYLEAIAGLHSTKIEALEAAAQLEVLTGSPSSLVRDAAAGEPA